MDFMKVRKRIAKNGNIELFPDFVIGVSHDIMIRGKSFYAVYDPESGFWDTHEHRVAELVDAELAEAAKQYENVDDADVHVKYMRYYDSGSWNQYKKYVASMFDNYHPLDERIFFANDKVAKEDYASKKLPYILEEKDCPSWNEIVGTLYSEEERRKIEWAIGAIVKGDSKNIQKFLVLYGPPGTGKSTILDIIEMLFDGYCTTFDAKQLASSGQFATQDFSSNPLVAIQQDGDLSKIHDNSIMNSIISHDNILIREKYKSPYTVRSNSFLFIGTNKPVQITDAQSGLLRRLIDAQPTGVRIEQKRYQKLMKTVRFELGAIAQHCLDIYEGLGEFYYDNYRPMTMVQQTDTFFNFVEEQYFDFKANDGVSLKRAWAAYKEYVEESKLRYYMPKYKFKAELMHYFKSFSADTKVNGERVKNYYKGFLADKVVGKTTSSIIVQASKDDWLKLENRADCVFDKEFADCPAQYATEDGRPISKWENVTTKLRDIDTTRLHYVRVPLSHVVIDFDIRDENGQKSASKNLSAASEWPPTYAEYSKSGAGVHLHYNYVGDATQLRRIFSENVEIKVFSGKSSLRRKMTKCNNLPIATLNSGLPLKGVKVINREAVKTERRLRDLILRSMAKEFGATKPSIDFIKTLTDEAYDGGVKYDITDLRPAVWEFAENSTNNSKYCIKVVNEMHFRSEDPSDDSANGYDDGPLVFFDCEVFPNLFLVNWKYDGKGKWKWKDGKEGGEWIFEGEQTSCVRMINPTPEEIGELFKYKLVGFNNRRYDNHILYARYIGYSNEELYRLSQSIVMKNGRDNMFGEAYNISYTDVYDFASSGHKMSLKKWEIKLGMHHQELGLPWDEPVDESLWPSVAEYCDNDVISTEGVFHYLEGDFKAREILAEIAGMTPNDSTNSLTTRIIFGKEKKPNLIYTDLATGDQFDSNGDKVNASELPNAFPGYEYKNGKNIFRGEDVGRGGYVFAEPGMYGNAITLDVASMHPHSIIAMQCFGEYTKKFEDLVNIRIMIKHGDYEDAGKLFDGRLKPYLNNKADAKNLSGALKTAINSVYGLTSASFSNPFNDKRNKNNIVALRGALFMVNLKHEVQDRGYKVIHIKTDSIKIADPTKEIIDFCIGYGKYYGYDFETEAKWDRICLVNKAVFIGKQTVDSPQAPGRWTATGAQFAQPYVYKTLFSHEPLTFRDFCETKLTQTSFYLDMNENLPEDEHDYHFVGRSGSFCPIKKGCGGGVLLRMEKDGRYSAATGTQGYRWLESEYVLINKKQDDVDETYFRNLADSAIEDISEFGDWDWFVGNDAPWLMPCGDPHMDSCLKCPHFKKDYDLCDLNFDISDVLLKEQ